MKRLAALLGVVSCVIAGLALGSGGVRAGEKEAEESHRDKRVEKRIEIIREGGGSFLGVGLEDVEGAVRGARVLSVEPESAAEEAGVEDGDVITGFDGESVRSASQLARLVRETPAGRAVPIEVKRDGSAKTLTATLAEGSNRFHRRLHLGDENVFVHEDPDIEFEVPERLPHGAGPHVFGWHGDNGRDFTLDWFSARPRLGIRFIEIGDQLAGYFGLAADEGVLVAAVEEDSPAAKAGIQAGDIVLDFGGKAVRDGGDLRSAVREATAGKSAAVKVQRKGKTRDRGVTLPEPEKPKNVRESSGGSL
jgi:serine protease Do